MSELDDSPSASPTKYERTLLLRVLEVLRTATQFEIGIESENPLVAPNYRADALIRVQAGKLAWPFTVEIKRHLTRHEQINALFSLEPKVFGSLLVVTEYVPPTIAEELKRRGIGYADSHGTFFLPLSAENHGRRREKRSEKPLQPAAASPRHSPISVSSFAKMVFALICKPSLLESTQREIAGKTNLSVGTVNALLNDLVSSGYIATSGGVKKLQKPGELIAQWYRLYSDFFQQKLLIGRYRFHRQPRQDWWKSELRPMNDIYWSGEVAADLMTGTLKPSHFLIYCPPPLAVQLIRYLKLVPDPNGEVELRTKFWNFDYQAGERRDLAPPLLVFGDLIASRKARNAQVANQIYERIIR